MWDQKYLLEKNGSECSRRTKQHDTAMRSLQRTALMTVLPMWDKWFAGKFFWMILWSGGGSSAGPMNLKATPDSATPRADGHYPAKEGVNDCFKPKDSIILMLPGALYTRQNRIWCNSGFVINMLQHNCRLPASSMDTAIDSKMNADEFSWTGIATTKLTPMVVGFQVSLKFVRVFAKLYDEDKLYMLQIS